MLWFLKLLRKTGSRILLRVPRRCLLWAGKLIGILWFDILRIRRSLVIENLQLAFPDLPRNELVRLGRRAMCVIGQNIVDVTLLPFLDEQWLEKYFVVDGLDNVRLALREEKGILLLGCHLGSGDLSIASLNYFGLQVNLISKEFKTLWLNRFWFRVRGRHGTRFIAARKSSFDILRALKRNETVIFVLDQFMGPPLGLKTKFFGKETGTAMGLALMAGRTLAPVIPCYTFIREDGRSQIVFGERISWQDQGQRDESIAHMTQVYTDRIEEIVRQHPDQWLWVHRRWKEFRD